MESAPNTASPMAWRSWLPYAAPRSAQEAKSHFWLEVVWLSTIISIFVHIRRSHSAPTNHPLSCLWPRSVCIRVEPETQETRPESLPDCLTEALPFPACSAAPREKLSPFPGSGLVQPRRTPAPHPASPPSPQSGEGALKRVCVASATEVHEVHPLRIRPRSPSSGFGHLILRR
jgi:hypothetical protein